MLDLRRRSEKPANPNPTIIIAQVAGSGAGLTEPVSTLVAQSIRCILLFFTILSRTYAPLFTALAPFVFAPAMMLVRTRKIAMFKALFVPVLLGATLFAITPAISASDDLSRWVAQVNKQIALRAELPTTDATGSAKISFRRDADGRPVDVKIESGQYPVALAGMQTVKKLRHLPPLPPHFDIDQRITMNFLVGGPDHEGAYFAQRAQMLASATASNAQLASRANDTHMASLERR